MKSLISQLKENRYTVNLHYVDVSVPEAMKRVVTRYTEEGGHFVDPEYIQKISKLPEQNYRR